MYSPLPFILQIYLLQVKSLNCLSRLSMAVFAQLAFVCQRDMAARACYVHFKFETSLSFTQYLLRKVKVPNSIATRAITKNRNDISRPPARLRQTLTFVFRHFHRISFQRGQYSIVILKLLD